jgi:hypothetical protein
MRRRALLGSLGMAALAGCSNGDDGAASATPTPTGTTTGTSTGSAEFEFVGVQTPNAAELNMPTTFAIGVRNVGTAAGTFTSELERRIDRGGGTTPGNGTATGTATASGNGEWETIGTIEMPLDAGELGEWRSPQFSGAYLETVHYRLAAFDETWAIRFDPKELDFGLRYAVPNGLFITVLGGSFESEYPTSEGNETASESTPTPTSPDGDDIWAVMLVEVRNRLQEAQSMPDPSTFEFTVNGESRTARQDVAADPYAGGTLEARTVARG